MNKLFSLLLWMLAVIGAGCRKDKGPAEQPGGSEGQWIVYNTANSRLPGNQVTAVAINKNDVKWIGTDKGLARIVDTTWTIYNDGNSPLPSSIIRALAVQEDGTIWVGTNNGLASFDGTTWQVYTKANTLMTDNGIMCITHEAKTKVTWIATEKELLKIDQHNTWTRFDALEDDLILSMAADQEGALWLGTFNHFAFRGRIRKFQNDQWTTFHLDQMGYASTFPYSIAVNNSNRVYAVLTGTSVKTVVELKSGNWHEVAGPGCATGLKIGLADQEGIWVGGNSLTRFGNTQAACLSMPGTQSNIQAIAMDSKRRLWLGTVHAGLAVYQTR